MKQSKITESLYKRYRINESVDDIATIVEDSCAEYGWDIFPTIRITDEYIVIESPDFENWSEAEMDELADRITDNTPYHPSFFGANALELEADYLLEEKYSRKSRSRRKPLKEGRRNRKLNESSYSEPLFERIEDALYNAGLNVTRFNEAGLVTMNLGWVVSDDDGNEVQMECLGTW